MRDTGAVPPRAPAPPLTWTLSTTGDLLRANHLHTAQVIRDWQTRHGLGRHWDAQLPEYTPRPDPASLPDVIRLPGNATAQQLAELAAELADVCGAEVRIGRATDEP